MVGCVGSIVVVAAVGGVVSAGTGAGAGTVAVAALVAGAANVGHDDGVECVLLFDGSPICE